MTAQRSKRLAWLATSAVVLAAGVALWHGGVWYAHWSMRQSVSIARCREMQGVSGMDDAGVMFFDETVNSERYVEVKITGLGQYFSVNCSADVPSKYQLYRVFDLSRDPRLLILHESLREFEPPKRRIS